MFDNQISSLMLIQLLSFSGMLIMFLFVIRSLSNQNVMLREATRQQQNALADMERQLMDMSFLIRNRVNGVAPVDAHNSDNTAPPFPNGVTDVTALLDPAPDLSAFAQQPALQSLNLGTPESKKSSPSSQSPLHINMEQ